MLHATSKQAEAEVQSRGQRGNVEQVHPELNIACAEGIASRAMFARIGEKAGILMSQPQCMDYCLQELGARIKSPV